MAIINIDKIDFTEYITKDKENNFVMIKWPMY